MAQAEEKLSVQVGEVDGIQINLYNQLYGRREFSTIKISLRLWRHSVLRSSHPMPPAPTSSARVLSNDILDDSDSSNNGISGLEMKSPKGALQSDPHKFGIFSHESQSGDLFCASDISLP